MPTEASLDDGGAEVATVVVDANDVHKPAPHCELGWSDVCLRHEVVDAPEEEAQPFAERQLEHKLLRRVLQLFLEEECVVGDGCVWMEGFGYFGVSELTHDQDERGKM